MLCHSFFKKFFIGILAVWASLFFLSGAWADDVNPPDWADGPNTVVAFWEDHGNGLVLDDWYIDDFSGYPLTGENNGEPGLEIFANLYTFFMPNFIDPLPVKHLRIQVTYFGNDLLFPKITSIAGHDSMPPGDVQGIFKDHVVDNALTPGALYFYEDWIMFPNPDWEVIDIFVPDTVQLQEVVIDTISTVPIPSAIILFASALGGLGFLGRRKK